jgi:hypothetical protein
VTISEVEEVNALPMTSGPEALKLATQVVGPFDAPTTRNNFRALSSRISRNSLHTDNGRG